MIVEQIPLENGTAQGLKFEMQHAALLVIKADRGFVMCGYLNIEIAQKLEDVAVRVSGVNSFEDVLNATINDATEAARKLGIEEGMNARDALERMF
ncbi:MAG: YunC family protein [Methanosarcinaceae archaeon]